MSADRALRQPAPVQAELTDEQIVDAVIAADRQIRARDGSSLSAKVLAADKFLAAYNACDADQNEETEQSLLDAIAEYEAIK